MGSNFRENALKPRKYQSAIADSVVQKGSSLVVLPTGMGKTLLALMVADRMVDKGNILFMAPTKPLAAQHESTVRGAYSLKDEEIMLVSGQVAPKKRKGLYEKRPKFLLSTPQTIANDLEAGRLKWNFSLCIFDEAHRAVGKYAYTKVALEAKKQGTKVLGLTASPGGQKKKIEEILDALDIKNVEIRTSEDEDVKPYVKRLEISWQTVELTPKILEIKRGLEAIIKQYSTTLRKMGYSARFNTKKGMAELRAKILASNNRLKFSALSYHASLFSLVHILELLESEGVEATKRFLHRLKQRDESKAQKRLLNDARFKKIEQQLAKCPEHPKVKKLVELISSRPAGEKFIVFSQYRDQVGVISDVLQKKGFSAQSFMGKKDGFTQKQQAKTLELFRQDKFDVLVATSIGEEGLDIPAVDNVIFYEPVPSEIRAIQRRGRAARAKMGRMFGIIAKGTRDEAFYWAALKKEQKMKRVVSRLSGREEISSVFQNKNTGRKKEKEPKQKKKKKTGQTRLSDYEG